MSNSYPHSSAQAGQASIATAAGVFTPDATPDSMNDELAIRELLTQVIRRCSKSRYEIAEEMSTLLGAQVTKRALDSYTCESAEQNRWPAQYTRAFCHVTGDTSLLRVLAERAGLHVISPAEAKLIELGRQHLAEKRAAREVARLEREIAEVGL